MRPKPQSQGFTLLELLVVVFIIGIIAAMATLSVGVATGAKGTDKEVERLSDLLALAGEEAVLQGREFGLTFYMHQYEFSAFDPSTGRWEPVADDATVLSPRKLPAEITIELEIDDRIVKLLDEKLKKTRQKSPEGTNDKPPGAPANSGKDQDEPPQIFILSSGDMTPFKVHLRPSIGEPGISLQVAENGSTKVIRDDM